MIAEAEPAALLAWNPEFLREGFAVQDTLHPDRLVYGLPAGADGDQARKLLDEVYATPLADGVPLVVTDYATAELVKAAANSFLATKISFINAMAEVCEASGADVVQLADAIGYDTRIGRRFLNAGLGFGGGCLPKDIRAFMARAGELGADQALAFLREIDSINMRRRVRMVDLAREVCGGSIVGRRIAVLGVAFKPNSDDIRDSPALNVAAQMQLQGASVVVTDPKAVDNAQRKWPDLRYVDDRRRGRQGGGPGAAADRMGAVPAVGSGCVGRDRRTAAHPGRPERPGPVHLARRGVDLPGAGASLRRVFDRRPHPQALTRARGPRSPVRDDC